MRCLFTNSAVPHYMTAPAARGRGVGPLGFVDALVMDQAL
jgi:hypothetical protein